MQAWAPYPHRPVSFVLQLLLYALDDVHSQTDEKQPVEQRQLKFSLYKQSSIYTANKRTANKKGSMLLRGLRAGISSAKLSQRAFAPGSPLSVPQGVGLSERCHCLSLWSSCRIRNFICLCIAFAWKVAAPTALWQTSFVRLEDAHTISSQDQMCLQII